MEKTISDWPGNKRLAVMVTVMFEVWSEGKAPPYSPMTTSLKPGTPDLLVISWSRYGGKTGVWRFMRILDDAEIKATVCLNARAAELFPEAVTELQKRGHEIAGHSYTQDLILPYLSPQEEKEVIQRCAHIIEQAVGVRPVGWFSPVPFLEHARRSARTRRGKNRAAHAPLRRRLQWFESSIRQIAV
jgi:peptidoglycan/xylan/chitin deacetylase (PgdA/CDA1 family)